MRARSSKRRSSAGFIYRPSILSGEIFKGLLCAEWADGQSTSVRKGINALPEQTVAALFLLGDQPYVSTDLLQDLLNVYSQTHPTILAPYVGERRSNPVLFDRSIFGELCQLHGDAGARSIFARYPPTPFIWPDDRLLFDVDTPEDYQKLIGDE